jgi:hypothetical protein
MPIAIVTTKTAIATPKRSRAVLAQSLDRSRVAADITGSSSTWALTETLGGEYRHGLDTSPFHRYVTVHTFMNARIT